MTEALGIDRGIAKSITANNLTLRARVIANSQFDERCTFRAHSGDYIGLYKGLKWSPKSPQGVFFILHPNNHQPPVSELPVGLEELRQIGFAGSPHFDLLPNMPNLVSLDQVVFINYHRKEDLGKPFEPHQFVSVKLSPLFAHKADCPVPYV